MSLLLVPETPIVDYWVRWDPSINEWQVSTDKGTTWRILAENPQVQTLIGLGGSLVKTPIAGKGLIYFDGSKWKVYEGENGPTNLLFEHPEINEIFLQQQSAQSVPLRIRAIDDGGSPLPLPSTIAGLTGWWSADAGVFSDAGSTPAVDNDTIRQWNDQSGNGRHFSQATAPNRPTFKTNIVNAKPVVRFGGGTDDDYMTAVAGSNFFAAGAKTAFVVFYHRANFSAPLWSVWDGAVNYVNQLGSNTGADHLTVNNDGATDTAIKTGLALGTWNIGTFLHSSGLLYSGANDTRDTSLVSSASGNTSSLANTTYLGVSNGPTYLDGDIAEVLFYNAALSQPERQVVEGYLANKYGITIPYGVSGGEVLTNLLLLEDKNGSEIFRVTSDGSVYVRGEVLTVP